MSVPDNTEFGLQGYFALITLESMSVTQPELVKVSTVHELKVSDGIWLFCCVSGLRGELVLTEVLTFWMVTVVLLVCMVGVEAA